MIYALILYFIFQIESMEYSVNKCSDYHNITSFDTILPSTYAIAVSHYNPFARLCAR